MKRIVLSIVWFYQGCARTFALRVKAFAESTLSMMQPQKSL
jgi:hypothetical protein